MAAIYTITHEQSGAIRIGLPGGTIRNFANAAYLAEAFVNATAEVEAAREWKARVQAAIVATPPETGREYQDIVEKAIGIDIPF